MVYKLLADYVYGHVYYNFALTLFHEVVVLLYDVI